MCAVFGPPTHAAMRTAASNTRTPLLAVDMVKRRTRPATGPRSNGPAVAVATSAVVSGSSFQNSIDRSTLRKRKPWASSSLRSSAHYASAPNWARPHGCPEAQLWDALRYSRDRRRHRGLSPADATHRDGHRRRRDRARVADRAGMAIAPDDPGHGRTDT